MILANAPQQIVEAWATGDATKTNPIPVPSQIGTTPGAASYTDGFPPLCATPIASGGIPPSKADMNGILFQMSGVDVWACAGGGFLYNSAFSAAIGGYPKGARVLMASGNGYWVSTVDNNVSDPDTGGSGWASADENAITQLTGDVTAVGPGSAAATLAASGVTAGSYAAANITVDAKGRVTAAANGGNVAAIPHNVTSLRAFGTTYTNPYSYPIFVSGNATQIGSGIGTIICNVGSGSATNPVYSNGAQATVDGYPAGFFFIVPGGYDYEIAISGNIHVLTTGGIWWETY
jgi:hypothetical protein